MSPRTITALECEDLERLDAPFYVKNRLRLYASSLRIADPNQVVSFYESALSSRHATTTMPFSKLSLHSWVPWAVGGGILLALAIALSLALW
jgi:cytoskeletal protein RodZ